MSLLDGVINQYDEEKLSDILKILGVKKPAGDKKEKLHEIQARLNKYSKMGLEYGSQALYIECLKITSRYLKIDYIDWVHESEEDQLKLIFDEYRNHIRRQLKKMRKGKRIELAEKYKEYLNSEGYGLAGSGATLLGALAAGEAAGFALFTSSAVGLKSLGLLLGTTFSFGTYSTVMSVLGVVFGPLGWTIALGIIGFGARRFIAGYRTNKVALVVLTITMDYFAAKEEAFQKKLTSKEIDLLVADIEDKAKEVETVTLHQEKASKDEKRLPFKPLYNKALKIIRKYRRKNDK